MRFLARLFSILLHPAWMPTIILVLAYSVDPYLSFRFTSVQLLILYGMVLCMTGLLPVMSTTVMARGGLVGSIALPARQDRIVPYFMTLLYYAGAYYLLSRTTEHPVTLSLFFGGILALLLTLLITLKWKISAHMVGIGGLVGALLGLVYVHDVYMPLLLAISFIAAGVLGTARLLDSDHTPAQIYAGVLLGVCCAFGCIRYGILVRI